MRGPETPLERELKHLIAADGPLRMDRYMELCLGHPVHGYYRTRDPFGAAGDFVTAPEVSQMFGELIAVWCVDVWDALDRPESLALIELGPGRGTLTSDILRTLTSIAGFQASLDVHLVEMSETLKAAQESTLAGCGAAVIWHTRLETVPDKTGIVIANEFFDALAIRQFEYRSGAWRERGVGLDGEGCLAIGLMPETLDVSEYAMPADDSNEGDIREISPLRRELGRQVAARLQAAPGAALVIDYGYAEPGFGDTLQAVKAHEPVDLLHMPGEADLTSHVDFADLARTFVSAGAQALPVITQRMFLRAMGIETRAQALKQNAGEAVVRDVDAALARLTDCDQMGNLFKVLAITSSGLRPPYPFGEVSS